MDAVFVMLDISQRFVLVEMAGSGGGGDDGGGGGDVHGMMLYCGAAVADASDATNVVALIIWFENEHKMVEFYMHDTILISKWTAKKAHSTQTIYWNAEVAENHFHRPKLRTPPTLSLSLALSGFRIRTFNFIQQSPLK